MPNTPDEILHRLRDQFSIIRRADGFKTDIGATVLLNALQRTGNKLPSIAIGTTSGTLNRTGETINGKAVRPSARALALTIEAALKGRPEDYLIDGLAMLEDIEIAWNTRVNGVMAPAQTGVITLDTWQILDRPEGMDATVLQILGSATYTRVA